jgi:hypothetical protein
MGGCRQDRPPPCCAVLYAMNHLQSYKQWMESHRRQIETIDSLLDSGETRKKSRWSLLVRRRLGGTLGHCVCWQTAAMCCDWRPTVADKFWFLVLFAIAIEVLTSTAPVDYLGTANGMSPALHTGRPWWPPSIPQAVVVSTSEAAARRQAC